MGKIEAFTSDPIFQSLSVTEQEFITAKSNDFHLTYQDIRRLIEIAADLRLSGEVMLIDLWSEDGTDQLTGRDKKRKILAHVEDAFTKLFSAAPDLQTFQSRPISGDLHRSERANRDSELLGLCPVASPKTRCCNLLTLDAVVGCGFRCSYCAVQSFYREGAVAFQPNLADRLAALELDPNKIYHIGTGQSSDSLMWGNRDGLLDALMDFAATRPNVILELKTKSANVAPLLSQSIPPNVLVTWSLNPQAVIDSEEHGAASLADRLNAAEAIASAGALIGFHLHPMMRHKGWEQNYGDMIDQVINRFDPASVAMVSFGTMTFIRPVVKALRASGARTKVLHMPMQETAGKYSYPGEIKQELMGRAYRCFAPWHGRTFFYLCMEDASLWQPVFGHSYENNEAFEKEMIDAYMAKINR